MTSDTILATAVVRGDTIKRQGRPDAVVIATLNDGQRMLITVQEVLKYRLADPVVVDRPAFHIGGTN